MTTDATRVLVIDDHAVVRHGLRAFLSACADIEVIGEAETGSAGVELAARYLPHVVLIDLVMPGLDGIAAIRQIKTISPSTQIIVLTNYSEDERLFLAIQAGALSFLLKDVKPADLQRAILAARQGEATLHPIVARRLMHTVVAQRSTQLDELTEREREVLTYIARGQSNTLIAAHLGISEGTVRTHVSNILSKLHLQDRTQAALFALRARLVPLDDVEQ
jgi:two-component system, NarL family, response regulator LiaR